jgi:hypothetical protein
LIKEILIQAYLNELTSGQVGLFESKNHH